LQIGVKNIPEVIELSPQFARFHFFSPVELRGELSDGGHETWGLEQ
jgi:hypothetical protein